MTADRRTKDVSRVLHGEAHTNRGLGSERCWIARPWGGRAMPGGASALNPGKENFRKRPKAIIRIRPGNGQCARFCLSDGKDD